ncbi:hypothetical protein KXW38_002350, partial [Aspergillus fumigatus]
AKADDADRADAFDRVYRGLGVPQHCGEIQIGDEFAGIGDFVRRVAALEVRLEPVEDRRRDRDIAFGGKAVAHRADMVVDAEDLLDHHDGPLGGTRGIGTIPAELESVRCGQGNVLSHGSSIPWFEWFRV